MIPSKKHVPTQPALSRNVWIVTATSFLTDVSSELIFSLLPLFLANVLGASTGVIGLIDGIAETTASLLKVFSGWLADWLQARKWLTVTGYSLSALSKPFLFITTSWVGVLIVRFADRVGKGVRNAPRDALLADSVSADHRGLAFGILRAGDTFGAALGLVIALLIVVATASGTTNVLTRDTFQMAVLISIVPAFLAVMVLVLGAQDVPVTSKRERPRLSLTGIDGRFRRFLPVILLFTLGNSSDAFLILRAQERGLSVPSILLMLIAFNVVYASASSPLGALSDRFGRRRVMIGGWFIYALIYLGFGIAVQTWQIIGLYIAYGLYYAATDGVARALISDIVPQEQRATAFGIFNTVVGIAALPASVLAGVLWQIGGPKTPFLAGALLAFLAILAFSRWEAIAASEPPK
jgi:MFS family permease